MVADPPGSSQYRSIGNGHHPERHLAFPASTDRCGSWPVFKRMREGGNAIRRSAMALNLTQKQEVVAELAEVAGSAHSLVAAEYVGLTVAQLTDMRKNARKEGVFLTEAKNTLVSREVENTDYAHVNTEMTAPLMFVFPPENTDTDGPLPKVFPQPHPTDMRKKARQEGVFLKVAKNTLVSRAVENTDYAVVKDALTGPLLYAFSQEDPGAAGRLIKEFAKANDKLKPRLVSLGGQMYPGSHVDVLASLPTRDEALSMLLSVMVQPATMLVRLLSEPAVQVARVTNAVGQQKAA